LEKPLSTNPASYTFIDSLRFISMISIVMEHCTDFFGLKYTQFSQQLVQVNSIQFFKFGTVIFFLLSGFLIGDKIKTSSPKEYLQRRFKNTFKPWLFWVFVLILLNYLTSAIIYFRFHPADFWQTPTLPITYQLTHTILYTSFWFIINFMVCLAILLAFKKYLDSFYFGGILFLFSVFYSVNLYFSWIPTEHTVAMLGFVFYLWLGYQLNRYFDRFKLWVSNFAGWKLVGILILTYVIACAESLNLLHLGSDDAFNTLRFSNIIYSLVFFVLLFKYSPYLNVSFFKPRQVTFGIYLIHQILVFQLIPAIFYPIHRQENYQSMPEMLTLQLIRFVIVYVTAYLITLLITYTPKQVRWIIGQ
jgi:hypothetical protein